MNAPCSRSSNSRSHNTTTQSLGRFANHKTSFWTHFFVHITHFWSASSIWLSYSRSWTEPHSMLHQYMHAKLPSLTHTHMRVYSQTHTYVHIMYTYTLRGEFFNINFSTLLMLWATSAPRCCDHHPIRYLNFLECGRTSFICMYVCIYVRTACMLVCVI